MEIYVGPAGWAYDDWRGIVYPENKSTGFDPLAYLSEYFDCIEINNSYYRIPDARACAGWVRRVSANQRFRFTVKLYKEFTHEIGESQAADAESFRKGIAPLHDSGRLGCVLAQFPWSFKNTAGNSDYLSDLFDMFQDFPLVLEVRHSSWNSSGFYDLLREHGVGFCNIDQPLFHDSMGPSAASTAMVGYFRLHGQNYDNWFRESAGRDARYDYFYSEEEIEGWITRIRTVSAHAPSVYVIMNNHFRGKAVCNALQIKARLTGSAVRVPPPLLSTYPQLRKIRASHGGQAELFEEGMY